MNINRTAFYDQLDAAADEAVSELDRIGMHRSGIGIENLPEPLRAEVRAVIDSWTSGQNPYSCRHDPRLTNPEPAMATMWKPGLVTCHQCRHLHAPVPTRCACGQPGEVLVVQASCLVVATVVCQECATHRV